MALNTASTELMLEDYISSCLCARAERNAKEVLASARATLRELGRPLRMWMSRIHNHGFLKRVVQPGFAPRAVLLLYAWLDLLSS